jgi:phenylalanyl-tRNA synthetase beta chain
MKVSLNWLKEYVSIDVTPQDLADRLTMAGLEVEAVIDRYEYLNTILVGRIASIKPHPKSDNLKICDVNLGERTLPIVCGAPNATVNMKAPCALPGTTLPSGLTIQESTIRGIASAGMLCSEAELELGTDKSGIYVLSDDLSEGVSLAKALNLSDIILEISLTPNRSDCLSIIGIAREAAALLNKPLRMPDIQLPPAEGQISDFTSVTRPSGILPAIRRQTDCGCPCWPLPFLAQGPADVRRIKAHQQYRGYNQLCHDGNGPTPSCIRL